MLGLNGAGKTSLLRILAGETEADLGDFTFGTTCMPGTTPRSTTTCARTSRCSTNIRDEVPPTGSSSPRPQLRGLLGMFGLSGDKVFQDSGTLSGGEKTKLALAMLMVGRNNLLLLDEPTNNLDPPVTPGRRRRPGRLAGGDHPRQPRRRTSSSELAPTKVLLMPDGDVDYFSDDWLDLVSMS